MLRGQVQEQRQTPTYTAHKIKIKKKSIILFQRIQKANSTIGSTAEQLHLNVTP